MPFQMSPAPSPMTRVPGPDYTMPSALPLPPPSSDVTGRMYPSPPRASLPRTMSYAERYPPEQPETARPSTAPLLTLPIPSVHHGSPLGASRNLPFLPSINERREQSASRPRSFNITFPVAQDQHRFSRITIPIQASSSAQSTYPVTDWPVVRSARHSSSLGSAALSHDSRPQSAWSERPRTSGYASTSRPTTSDEGSISGRGGRSPQLEPSTPVHEQNFYASSESSFGYPRTPDHSRPDFPTSPGKYSRVLVGSLYSVCQRLQDQHGQQGLFFFAHDLGVRTEGIFTLRFNLMSLAP